MGYIKVHHPMVGTWLTWLSKHVYHSSYRHVWLLLMQPWLSKVIEKLPEDQQAEFKGKAQASIKFLIGKIKDLQL